MALILKLIPPTGALGTNQTKVVMLSVQNTGGSDVTISGIQTYLSPAAAAGVCAQVQLPPGSTLVVATGATNFYPFNVAFQAPAVAGTPAASSAIYQINATVYSNDTVAVQAAPSINVAVTPALLWTASQNPTSPGWLDFTQPANTGLLALGIY